MQNFLVLAILSFLCLDANAQWQSGWTPRMDSLARITECKYCLPAGTCKAFSLQESSHNRNAVRVEANYVEATGSYAKRVRTEARAFAQANNWQPSFLTEVYQRGASFSQYQIMGINLRALGYKGKFMSEMRLSEQFDYFGRFVAGLIKRWPKQTDWVAAYNAGSPRKKNGLYINQSYVNNVTKYIKQFSY